MENVNGVNNVWGVLHHDFYSVVPAVGFIPCAVTMFLVRLIGAVMTVRVQ